jgi:hypothetical protein
LEATLEEIETDFWAHHYADNRVVEEIEDDEFDPAEIERQWAEEQAAHAGGGELPPDDDFETIIDMKSE